MGVIQRRPEGLAVGARDAIPLIETAIGRKPCFGATKMPLTPNSCGILLRREELRQRNLPERQPLGDASSWNAVGARSDGKTACHQRGTRWSALGLDVEIQ